MGGAAPVRHCVYAVHVCQRERHSGDGDAASPFTENYAPTSSLRLRLSFAIQGYVASSAIAVLSGRLHGDLCEAHVVF